MAHPSQPNYLALVSGSTQGITNNDPHDVSAPTVFGQVEAAGRTWRVYAENVPQTCFKCHDMHDCTVSDGDAWLRTFVPRILESASSKAGGALFITFDEGSTPARARNTVATIVVGPGAGRHAIGDATHALLAVAHDPGFEGSRLPRRLVPGQHAR